VLLKAISHSLQTIRGVEDSCYRMGGDEFIVIVPDNSEGRLERITQSIQQVFAQPWFLKGEDYYCTMSMGVACFPTDSNAVDELIRKADMALFTAKRQGKNRIEFYDDKDAVSAYRRLDMEKNMRKATLDACREFEVYYQPIVDITKDGDPCCGAEALIRWNSSEMGFVSPVDFIPLAEYLGLINPIGEYILREAAARCRHWNEMGHPEYKVNVNLSVVQLLQNDIVKKVKNVLEETRINPQNLTLEVTESLAINDIDRMKTILSQIKSLGVRVALDDFGTGYSSLNHIRELPIDVIKIDRCFIEHIADDDFSDAFVKMVSELAATLGLSICTEGVELAEQYEIVKGMRIKYIQGYYFGKPMRIGEFEQKYL
jgi:predicted signal transduction protein with EAL and GGDEF domain